MGVRPRLRSPLLETIPRDVRSCEHCRTVTWAGYAACGCEFSQLAADQAAVARLCGDDDVTGRLDECTGEGS